MTSSAPSTSESVTPAPATPGALSSANVRLADRQRARSRIDALFARLNFLSFENRTGRRAAPLLFALFIATNSITRRVPS